MAIKNISQFQSTLNSTGSNNWLRSADFKAERQLGLNKAPTQITGSDSKSFGDFLLDSLSKVNELQKSANTEIESLASGKSKNIHQTMVAIEKAEIAFKSMNQVRMKVLDAYREIMKMQV
jgi:flagellar hook-basal body complex protein FliE